jgi:transcriptional regulator with XRE-family HTH domain
LPNILGKYLTFGICAYYIRQMTDLISIGEEVAARRRELKLSQAELARRAGVSRATVDALENGRTGELGFTKVAKLLAVLGLELTTQAVRSRRPTLDELMEENRDDQGVDRRR